MKTTSTTTTPTTNQAMLKAMTVAIGAQALGKAWRKMISASLAPESEPSRYRGQQVDNRSPGQCIIAATITSVRVMVGRAISSSRSRNAVSGLTEAIVGRLLPSKMINM